MVRHRGWYARFDGHPVSPGHLLLITDRHVPTFFEATRGERVQLLTKIDRCKRFLDERFHPDGFNFGFNTGRAACQTVMHLHVHVIPRYAGETPDPCAGVPGLIPQQRTKDRNGGEPGAG